MATKKKTFDVVTFKNKINEILANKNVSEDEKSGLCTALEIVLSGSGNYNGYQDNYWNRIGWKLWREAGEPEGAEKDQFIYGDEGKYSRKYN